MTLNDIRNTPVIDCCQAMDWIEHNYTPGLPHENTPRNKTYNRDTKEDKRKDSAIQRTIDSFVYKQFTKDWR
ncbi:MAG: hypothetical protein IPJ03_15840 [Ignavibacteriales bacterium]|nr:hypothetical protein [Ignavibacteriales bacterium]